jgi:hypothetical protein
MSVDEGRWPWDEELIAWSAVGKRPQTQRCLVWVVQIVGEGHRGRRQLSEGVHPQAREVDQDVSAIPNAVRISFSQLELVQVRLRGIRGEELDR